MSELSPPVKLIVTPNGHLPDVPINGAEWVSNRWVPLVTEAQNEAAIVSLPRVGGTFTLILDLKDGVTLAEPDNLWILYIFIGCFMGVFLACVIAGIACDLSGQYKGTSAYPHRHEIVRLKGITSAGFFNFIFRYSLLYNTPFLSVFSYRDPAIFMWARVLWFFGLLGVIWSGALILFETDTLIRGSPLASILTYSAIFALLFIPNSFFINMLTETPI